MHRQMPSIPRIWFGPGLVRDQEDGGSNPLAPTTYVCQAAHLVSNLRDKRRSTSAWCKTQALLTLNAFAAPSVFPVVRQNLIRTEDSGLSSLVPPFRIRKSSVLTGHKQGRHRAA